MPIPMSSPDLTEAKIATVTQLLTTPVLSIGPPLETLEPAVAAAAGTAHAAGANAGTSGLHLAAIAAGVRAGDLVITTPFSFIPSANSILSEHATPSSSTSTPPPPPSTPPSSPKPSTTSPTPAPPPNIGSPLPSHATAPANLQPSTFNLQPTNLQPKAILPVHAFGQPADMDPILAVAREHGLAVIEDACEALGAEYKGRQAGTLGDAAVFAFYPNKQITTGEGGMLVTDREEWAILFRSLRNQGRDVFDAWLNHTRLGYNYRLDELSAALGLAQLGRLEELLAKRARVAGWYNERLAPPFPSAAGGEGGWGDEGGLVERPHLAPTTTRMSWFVYVVRIKPPASRDEVMRRLAAAGIPSRPYFTPIHLQPFYRQTFGYQRGDFPVTEALGDVSLALPFSSVMTEDQVDEVCERLRQSVAG